VLEFDHLGKAAREHIAAGSIEDILREIERDYGVSTPRQPDRMSPVTTAGIQDRRLLVESQRSGYVVKRHVIQRLAFVGVKLSDPLFMHICPPQGLLHNVGC
jgi:hypothetical protein